MQQREMRSQIRELELRVGMGGLAAGIIPASQLVPVLQQRLDPAMNPTDPVGMREAGVQQTVQQADAVLHEENQQHQNRIQQQRIQQQRIQRPQPEPSLQVAATVPSEAAAPATTVHQAKTQPQTIKPQLPSAKPQPPSHPHQSNLAKSGTVPLPAGALTHFFLSHSQATGGDQTNAIYLELRQMGFSCWYDNR